MNTFALCYAAAWLLIYAGPLMGDDTDISSMTFPQVLSKLAVDTKGCDKDPSTNGCQTKQKLMIDALLKEVEFQKSAIIEIGGGFTGDESFLKENDSKFKSVYVIQTQATFKKGSYPREFRFDSNNSFKVDKGEAKESVTQLRFNYDYHPHRMLEIFGFLERFTDDFLEIQERYEAGFGAKLEVEIGHGKKNRAYVFRVLPGQKGTTQKGFTTEEKHSTVTIKSGRKPLQAIYLTDPTPLFDCAPKALSSDDLNDLKERFEELKDQLGTALSKRKAKYSFGISSSIFSEVEQSQVTVTPVGSVKEKQVTLPGDQQFRWVVRPSFLWQPTDEFSVEGHYYLKFHLAGGTKIPLADLQDVGLVGKRDYRTDLDITANLALSKDESNPDAVGIAVSFIRRVDNLPPFLTVKQAADQQIEIAGPHIAPRAHNQYMLTLKVSLGK